jgi:hypothetical protein
MRVRVLCVLSALIASSACERAVSEESAPTAALPITAWAERIDTLPGEYTRVMRPTEFWDSVLIVPDVGEQLMWKVDRVSGERSPFGSRGGGPGEYPRVGWAMKVHADSVAITQLSAFVPFPVISVATGTGRTQRFDGVDSLRSLLRVFEQPTIRFADTLGNLYADVTAYRDEPGAQPWPSPLKDASVPTVPRLRLSLRSGRADTSGFVPVLVKVPGRTVNNGNVRQQTTMGPYSPYNGWLTLPDGRSLLAGGGTYVLEVVQASGVREGPWTVPHPSIHASHRGYAAWLAERQRRSGALVASTLMRAGATERPTTAEIRFPPKPEQLPPLALAGIRSMHGAGDVVWIPVHVEDPPVREIWDLVHITTRTRECRVAMPQDHRLLLVTENGAYVAVQDESHLERIVRYHRPEARCTPGFTPAPAAPRPASW